MNDKAASAPKAEAAKQTATKFEVLKACKVSGHDRKAGDKLVLGTDVTPLRAEKHLKAGEIKAIG